MAASLADVTMDAPDDASMPEDEDATSSAEELASVLGLGEDKVEALKSALTAFVLSVK